MSRLSLAWSIVGAVLLAALLAWLTLTRTGAPSRAAPTTQHDALAPFHEVEIGGTAHVTLLQGDDLSSTRATGGAGGAVSSDGEKAIPRGSRSGFAASMPSRCRGA